ncbi:F-box domain containing protein [Trema orientale]|uniref:F-box domain containing protein n=1 Tax=Trema orientale TaxID=63057 RepID=A0A2P5F3U7_TREOI|nr:F-box domain containing protein [Trema orientale]
MGFTKTSRKATVSGRATPPHSAEIIASNDDLLSEILFRLPIKALVKFKSVSKHWRSLISDPKFALRRNTNPNPNPASGLFVKRSSRPEFDFVNLGRNPKSISSRGPFRSLNFADDLSVGVGIVQSCNGLMLCSTNQAPESREYFVYNPTVNRYATLPPFSPTAKNLSRSRFGVNLAFDPSRSPHYNVVCVRRAGTRFDQFRIEIYSSETRRWRPCAGLFTVNSLDCRFDGGVFWNGSLHWMSTFGDSVYFDVEEEKLSTMPMPPLPDGWDDELPGGWDERDVEKKYLYFGESMGRLHLIVRVFEPQMPHFDVLEMEMDHSGWFVKFRVDVSGFSNNLDSEFSVLCDQNRTLN